MSAQVTCQLIQNSVGIEAVNHFCCRDRNILGIQSELLGAHTVGVRNLICITGDPPRMGTYPDATAVFDVDAIGLTNIVNNLNQGLDIGGNPIGSQTALLLGVGTGFGVRAVTLGSRAGDGCPNMLCTPAGLAAVNDGRSAANVANGTLVAGGALAATGVVLLILSTVLIEKNGSLRAM